MGDEVGSIGSMFLRIWTVSSQSLKAVVTSVKNFRWASPLTHRTGDLMVGNDMLWIIFGTIPLLCTSLGIVNLMGDPRVYKFFMFFDAILTCVAGVTHNVVLYSIHYWYRDKPFHIIGAKGKFMLEFIPMIMLAAFHHLLEFNYGYLLLVVGLTTYFYTIAHFMHTAYDIRGKDIFLVLVMQVLAYILKGGLLVRGLALSLCVGLCLCRYVMYCAPEIPTHRKKDLERLPC